MRKLALLRPVLRLCPPPQLQPSENPDQPEPKSIVIIRDGPADRRAICPVSHLPSQLQPGLWWGKRVRNDPTGDTVSAAHQF
jgi:hypothetical protein